LTEHKKKTFLKIPAIVKIFMEDNEDGELVDGCALIVASEVQDIISDNSGKTTIFFKSGDALGTSLTLDELEMIFDENR
jgi:hypothetical protein